MNQFRILRTTFARLMVLMVLALSILTVFITRFATAAPPAHHVPDGLTAHDWQTIQALLAPQTGYLKATNADAGDFFGRAVAVDDDTVVVGAWGEASSDSDAANNAADNAGAAYVFTRTDGHWTQIGYLKAANAEANDMFGWSVAVDGDTVVVGASREDSSGSDPTNNAAPRAGAAYVFTRTAEGWTQTGYLKAANAEAEDYFGWSVAVDGDTVVIGAYSEDSSDSDPINNAASSAGAAYVFTRTSEGWTQSGYLKAANAEESDIFGYSVAVDENTVVVGAYNEDSSGADPANNATLSAGAAYVFTRTSEGWTQTGYLKAANAEESDIFGYSVAMDGDTIVMGAPYEDSSGADPANNAADNAGAAYVFTRTSEGWTQTGYLKAANAEAEDYFGWSVAVDGNTVVVGAWGEDSSSSDLANNDAPFAGAAYVFTRTAEGWMQTAYLKAVNTETGDNFGSSVAIYGDIVVVGAYREDSSGSDPANNAASSAGAVYTFDLQQFALYLPLVLNTGR